MSDIFHIVGGTPLFGEVTLSGCKNGALPILAATLLVQDVVTLTNVPQISDIEKMCRLMELLGAKVTITGNTVTVDARELTSIRPDRDLSAAMRASFYIIGPLLARLGQAEVPLPGGCAIGSRPVDYVVEALEKLGVHSEEKTDVVVVSTEFGLKGATVTLNPQFRSPGATFNVAMAASLADGKTIIENASADPEVENFCAFLQASGVSIDGVGTNRLEITGSKRLHGCSHEIVCDRIEAGTYLAAGLATRGEVRVSPIKPAYLESLLQKMEEMGATVLREENAVTVRYEKQLRGVTVFTEPYPGFPTDLQPLIVVLMCLAAGGSSIIEGIYDGRLTYVHELRRMGAKVKLEDSRQATIEGVTELEGRAVEGADMRAGAALVVAALAARGESKVAGLHYVLRGYEAMKEKLRGIGAQIDIKPE